MIKVKGDPIATKLERMATYDELQALRARVTALEERYQKSNAMSPAEKQKAYRARRKVRLKDTVNADG